MVGTGKVRISLYLSKSVLKEVDRAAAMSKVSRSAYIDAVLRQHFEQQRTPPQKTD
jgi:metal-responsive CopG/Arc/MetJ family transcriptional regulator